MIYDHTIYWSNVDDVRVSMMEVARLREHAPERCDIYRRYQILCTRCKAVIALSLIRNARLEKFDERVPNRSMLKNAE